MAQRVSLCLTKLVEFDPMGLHSVSRDEKDIKMIHSMKFVEVCVLQSICGMQPTAKVTCGCMTILLCHKL